jgi:hypothetical protein
MATTKAKAVKKPVVSKGDKTHYSQQAVIDGFMAGKSIRELAEAQKMSTVYAHRILTTKVPKEYAAEQARRAAAKAKKE